MTRWLGLATVVLALGLVGTAAAQEKKPEPGKPEQVKPEPAKPEQVKPEPGKPQPVKPEAGKQEAGKPEAGKPEQVKPEVGKADAKPAGAPTAPQAAPKPKKDKYVIGFSQCTVKEPWRVEFNKRLKECAEKKFPQVQLDMLDADDKTEKQVGDVKSFIRRGVDAILLSPKESAGLAGVVKEATEAGIPVIVLDRDVTYQDYAAFVGGDNKVIGRAAGKVAVDMLGGPGKAKGVIYEICGGLASTPGQERRDGFHEVVDKEPGIKVLGGLDADWKKDRAHSIMQDALKANKEIDLVYAHNDPMAHGAFQAAKAAGRAEEIKFIGIDALPDEGQRWVKSGELTATLLYPTPGEAGLELAMKILVGEKVDKRVTLPTRVFTKENVDKGGE
jgi:ribose transport system substrate-binding protein